MMTFSKIKIAAEHAAKLFWALANFEAPKTNARVFALNRNPMGFRLTKIAAGASVVISSPTMIPFRGTVLSIPDHVAERCLILDLRVGKDSQLCNANPLPGMTFAASHHDLPKMRLDVAQVGASVSLTILNTSDGPLDFEASMFGDTLAEDVEEVPETSTKYEENPRHIPKRAA